MGCVLCKYSQGLVNSQRPICQAVGIREKYSSKLGVFPDDFPRRDGYDEDEKRAKGACGHGCLAPAGVSAQHRLQWTAASPLAGMCCEPAK